MWMVRSGIQKQARLHGLVAKIGAFQHAKDGFSENFGGVPFQHALGRSLLETSWITSMPAIELILPFVSRKLDLCLSGTMIKRIV